MHVLFPLKKSKWLAISVWLRISKVAEERYGVYMVFKVILFLRGIHGTVIFTEADYEYD